MLIVDDDPAIRLLCSAALELEGWDVIEAENGQEALALARTAAPDALLLDISMPVLDGFGLAAALRTDPRTRALPFAFLTGELEPHVLERAHQLGAAQVFAKPFDPGVVADFVRRMIGGGTVAEPAAAAFAG